jgi:hypothetical protein
MKRDRLLSQLKKDRTLVGVKVLADYLEDAESEDAVFARLVAEVAGKFADAIEMVHSRYERLVLASEVEIDSDPPFVLYVGDSTSDTMIVAVRYGTYATYLTEPRHLRRSRIPTKWMVRMKVGREYLERRSIELAEEALNNSLWSQP